VHVGDRLAYIMGTGHEICVFVRCLNSIAWNYGGDLFAFLHGYTSEGGQNSLRLGKDNHKVKAFLMDVCRPAIMQALIREWAESLSDNLSQRGKDIKNIEKFICWLEDASTKDLTFKSHVHFWVTDAIPGLALAIRGQYSSDFFAHSAGRKKILPYLWVRGNLNYGRLIIEDIIDYHYRCTNEVLQLRIDAFTCAGNTTNSAEGYDFKHESVNKDIKTNMTSDSKTQFQWGAFSASSGPAARKKLLELNGMKERQIKSRREQEMIEDKRRVEQYLWTERFFKKDETRTDMRRYDGTVIKDSADSRALNTEGQKRMPVFIDAIKMGKTIKFPPAITMTDEEDVKKHRAREKIDVEVENDEEKDENEEEK